MVRFASAVLVALTWLPVARAADFVGSESCRSCHQEAYEQWRGTAHARAHSALSPAQQKDARCMQCHGPNVAQGGDTGVSCETCHGAGEYYWPTYVMRDADLARATGLMLPDGKSCLLCHDASSPSLQQFDPATKLREIDHWTKSRAAREKKKAAGNGCNFRQQKARQAAARAASPDTFLARTLRGKPAVPPAVQVAQAAPAAPARP